MNCPSQTESATYRQARDLHAEWDVLCADNYALKRRFLDHMERGNPVDQQYHVFRQPGGGLDSILVTFRARKCNILMFTPFMYRADVTFVHVPFSVARPGFVIGDATRAAVAQFLSGRGGLVIVLNAPPGMGLAGFATGLTCSDIVLRLRWHSFGEYVACMRSHYRYRVRAALEKGVGLRFRILDGNQAFDERLYGLYENVHANSRIRVEKLQPAFFRAPLSRILICESSDGPVGFIQMIENGDELVFAFIGLDYAVNRAYDTYLNLLLKMVEYGIDHGFKYIDMGQTAEDAKMKLGGEPRTLHALVRHSNPFANWLLHRISRAISYRAPPMRHRVFREDAV